MLNFLHSKQISTIAFLLLLFAVLKIPFALYTFPDIQPLSTLWGLSGAFFSSTPLLSWLIAQICILLQAFWFNYLFTEADFNERFSFVPALYYILVTSLLPVFNFFSIYTLVAFILLALLHNALIINLRKSAKMEAFNMGVLGGILVLLDTHFFIFLPSLFVMLYVLKPFRFKEFMLLFFGWMMPVYFYLSIAYLFDIHINLSAYSLKHFSFFRFDRDVLGSINLIATALLILFSFISLRGIMYSTGFKRKKNVSMLIVLIIAMSIILVLSGRHAPDILQIVFIPAAVLLSLLMLRIRNKKLGEIFNAVYIAIILAVNLLRIFYS